MREIVRADGFCSTIAWVPYCAINRNSVFIVALCVQHEIALWRALSGVWWLCEFCQTDERWLWSGLGISPTVQRDVVI